MNVNDIVNYLGITGGTISIINVIVFWAKKIIKSNCIRDQNGRMHLDLSLNLFEIEVINRDEELKKMLFQLKDNISKRTVQPASSPKNKDDIKITISSDL